MKKIVVFVSLVSFMAYPIAGRIIPRNFNLYSIVAVQDPYIKVRPPNSSWLRYLSLGLIDNAKELKLAPGLRIRNERNLFIVRKLLSNYKGRVVAVRYDTMGMVNEVLILTEKELFEFKAHLDKEAARIEALQNMSGN